MRESTTRESKPSTVFLRLPRPLNRRIDAEVLRRKCRTGEHVTRARLLIEMLEAMLPPLPEALGVER